MLLPQSSAFAALKNRLNSVSSIGYLHIAPRPYVVGSTGAGGGGSHSRQGSVVEAVQSLQLQAPPHSSRSAKFGNMDAHALPHSSATTPGSSSFDRPNRLKSREDGIIRWNELLEKFRSVQERQRRSQRPGGDLDDGPSLADLRITAEAPEVKAPKEPVRTGMGPPPVPVKDVAAAPPAIPPKARGLGRPFGRLGGARGKRPQQ